MGVTTRFFAWTLLLVGGVAACGSVNSDPNPSSVRLGIRGGQPDSGDANVFLLVSHRGMGAALCSASLIAPNLLLTARHCVSSVAEEQVTCGMSSASAPFSAGTFYATNAESIDQVQGPSVFQGASVAVPAQASDLCGFDIALVTLDTVVPSSVAVPLVPRIDRAVQAGEAYRAVGYGETTPGDAGMAGVRMARAGLKVSCAPGGACGTGIEADEFIGDTGICSGDSGGPALDPAGKVVGVVSRGGPDCSSPVYGSVASWKDWIVGVAKEAAALGKYSPPFWVDTGISDPPAAGGSSSAGGASGAAGAAGIGANDEAGAPGQVNVGTQGKTCSGPQDCKSGFGCFSPTGMASNAYCAAFCTSQAQCKSGTVCDSGPRVCIIEPPVGLKSSSCAAAGPGSRGVSGSGVLLGGLVLGLLGRRRRRAPAAKRARAARAPNGTRSFWCD